MISSLSRGSRRVWQLWGGVSLALTWQLSPGTGPAPRHRRVTTEPTQRYEIRFQPSARRAIAHRLPEAVAAAVLEFCDAGLAGNPHRVGKPLFGPLAGCHGARRGTYRIVYRIDATAELSTSSTLTTARTFTTAPKGDFPSAQARAGSKHRPASSLIIFERPRSRSWA